MKKNILILCLLIILLISIFINIKNNVEKNNIIDIINFNQYINNQIEEINVTDYDLYFTTLDLNHYILIYQNPFFDISKKFLTYDGTMDSYKTQERVVYKNINENHYVWIDYIYTDNYIGNDYLYHDYNHLSQFDLANNYSEYIVSNKNIIIKISSYIDKEENLPDPEKFLKEILETLK